MKIVGVDAGQKGAFAFFNTIDNSLAIDDVKLLDDRTLDTPYHFSRLMEWEPDIVVVEDCFRPKSLIRFVGEVVAMGKILQAEVEVVAVVTWKTAMLGQNTSDKTQSVRLCEKMWPDADLIRPRAKTPSADRAEAVLLAVYMQRIRTGTKPAVIA